MMDLTLAGFPDLHLIVPDPAVSGAGAPAAGPAGGSASTLAPDAVTEAARQALNGSALRPSIPPLCEDSQNC